MDNTNILISGASVAGPALAYWLRRHGFSPTVVERAPAVRSGGYPVDLRGVAVDVAERAGVYNEIRECRTGMRGMTFVDAANRPLTSSDMNTFDGRGNRRDVEVPRGDVARVLHAATRDDVEYVFGDSITGIDQRADGVRVTFERGEPRDFDLVIGADGLHSRVRSLAFGPEERFRRHLGYYVSIFTTENHLRLDHWTLLHNAPGRLAGIYSARDRTRANAILGFASPEFRFDHRDPDQQRAVLRSAFAGIGWEVPRLLDAADEAPDFYFDAVAQIHLDSWSRDRVALVGDAGYGPSPMSGQGTSLAVVGAYVLAGELKAAGGNHRIAFARYEELLRDFVARNQEIAGTGGKTLMPSSRAQIWLRNQIMRLASLAPRFSKVAEGIQKAANSLELPVY
ncbi:FAD-dependent monooxygenase [Saccharopolyspora taberi]|uniref:FAD-dependent monooxygenase n=1 Tax=Saccharopolyspora taberi TaxID=60895 RepID=A0ABN3V5E2_9PSEU